MHSKIELEESNSLLQTYLLRTQVSKEREFKPQKLKLGRKLITQIKHKPGDIAVKVVPGPPSRYLLRLFSKCQSLCYRGSLSDHVFRYNIVTIESTLHQDPDLYNNSAKGLKLTYHTSFAPERVLEVLIDEEIDLESLGSACAQAHMGTKAHIVNNNKLLLTDRFGVSRYFVLSGYRRVAVNSFSLTDIVYAIIKLNSKGHFDPNSLSLWRPLHYFWTNEAYLFRLVVAECNEHAEEAEKH